MTPTDLKQWRIARHLTQAQASELVGAGSYRTWQNYELKARPVPGWLVKTIKLLDINK